MLRFLAASLWMATTSLSQNERQCSGFGTTLGLMPPSSQQVNGNAPFFLSVFGVFGKNERICSVF
ncbi:MAG: hypothetical protein WCS15_11005 [Prevotella sp.]|jgi:hypothetical protein